MMNTIARSLGTRASAKFWLMAISLPLLAGCQIAGMTHEQMVTTSIRDYVTCTTQQTVKAGKANDPLAQAEAECATKREAYHSLLLELGLSSADAETATAKLVDSTRAALKQAGVA